MVSTLTTDTAVDDGHDPALVYHIDVLILAVIAAFGIIRLPRALARLATSDRFTGFFLHHVHYRTSRQVVPRYLSTKDSEGGDNLSPHTPYSPAYNTPHRLTPTGARVVLNFPPHIADCPKILRPLVTLLRARPSPGLSAAQVLLLFIYFSILFYAGFYKSNIINDIARTGWVSLAQLPFVFALAQKNNIIGLFLGYGYEKLHYLHRFGGRIVVLAANIHSIHYIYQYSFDGTIDWKDLTVNAKWGFVALGAADLIFLSSLQYVRDRAYNLFLVTHAIGFVAIIPSIYLHQPGSLPFLVVAAALYGFDRFMRIIKSRITTAHIRPIPELDLTRIEIPSINAGWRAGQHVRINVLSSSMGMFGWAEVHPFTIASVSKGPDGMVLMCKRRGKWSKNLYELAKMGGYMTEGSLGKEVKAIVEGPYGGPGHSVFSSFSGAIFIAGGTGITFALCSIQDLINKDLNGLSRVKTIELIWIVPDPSCLGPLLSTFNNLIQQSVFTPLQICVFYTRAPTGKQPAYFSSSENSPFAASEKSMVASPSNENFISAALRPVPPARPHSPFLSPRAAPHPPNAPPRRTVPGFIDPSTHFALGLSLAPGRPRIVQFIESVIQRTISLSRSRKDEARLTGLIVGVCGPVGLVDDVSVAVSAVEPVRRDQVGGVELHEEVFGW